MSQHALLDVQSLEVSIQSMAALRGLSMTVQSGEMIGLIGRNGAGKTTFMRTVMGHLQPSGGTLTFGAKDLVKASRSSRAADGIGYMPEDRGLVPQLTVEENILLPVWVSKTLKARARLDFVYGLMPEVAEMRDRKALLLSGGQQKLVALGRALAVGTRMLLLDEPFEGVAPALSQRLSEVIFALRGKDLAVVISQSDLNHSRKFFDREYVIERGANVAKAP
ncbi:ATP-binding cassette domain-containing protein [Noviherbaspirillum sp. Root189]|uniref:ATP-binding cassette domain-containing protein n=1 Tax=Noviherbaspirillum sp. Root189 TaxID=1736487 RepID=UPI00070F6009|nr:ATP-binding cassette domain-containing protein [Noviherbaspirillum sp. Root189]KRB84038.1 ABC transporter ATP-binding protein [Noviherbaspirillum sp. Root189]